MAKYLDDSLKKYLDDLSAKLPAPGGGSASALVAAAGVALLEMTANFTVEKKGYEQYHDEMIQILQKLKEARERLYVLVDLDIGVYNRVSEAYKLPGKLIEEKNRENIIQGVLKEAAEVPFEVMAISSEMAQIAKRLAVAGNKNLLSDVGCGILFLDSALKSAKFNVEINLKLISDGEFVSGKRKKAGSFAGKVEEAAAVVVALTQKSLI